MQSLSRNVTNNTSPLLLPMLLEFEADRTAENQKEDEKDIQNVHQEDQIEVSRTHNLKVLAGETMNKLYPELVGQNNIYSFTHIRKDKITKKNDKSKLRVKIVAEKDKISMQIEFENTGWNTANKTWILKQRTNLLRDILYDIFQVSKEQISKVNQKERGILLCEILGMDTNYIG
eukprot:26728_1